MTRIVDETRIRRIGGRLVLVMLAAVVMVGVGARLAAEESKCVHLFEIAFETEKDSNGVYPNQVTVDNGDVVAFKNISDYPVIVVASENLFEAFDGKPHKEGTEFTVEKNDQLLLKIYSKANQSTENQQRTVSYSVNFKKGEKPDEIFKASPRIIVNPPG